MPRWGRSSNKVIDTCDPRLRYILDEHIKTVDSSAVWGYRGEDDQNEMFRTNVSKVKYPNSKHNVKPSLAIDIVPYHPRLGKLWGGSAQLRDIVKEFNVKGSHDKATAKALAWVWQMYSVQHGSMMACAEQIGQPLRGGMDWNRDGTVLIDQKFDDGAHFEIYE